MPFHTPIPNEFTIEPVIEVSLELFDGTRVFRQLTKTEFLEWQASGGDPEDLRGEEDA